mgnify:CR=1 FL=1
METTRPIVLRSGNRDEQPGCGHLLTPLSIRPTGRRYFEQMTTGTWACDNDCFRGFNVDAYLRMLAAVQGRRGCVFVAAPDVLENWTETRTLFDRWQPVVKAHQLPVAIVLQDGATHHEIPWNQIDGVFIGGSTKFKLCRRVASFSGYARATGLWVHMGRVNTSRRYNHASQIGCHSVDGSTFSWFPDEGLRRLSKWNKQGRFHFA